MTVVDLKVFPYFLSHSYLAGKPLYFYGIFHTKKIFLLILMSFQTCLTLIFLWNTKDNWKITDDWKSMRSKTTLDPTNIHQCCG